MHLNTDKDLVDFLTKGTMPHHQVFDSHSKGSQN